MDARRLVTPKDGDRYPIRPPDDAEYGRGLSAWSHKPRIAGSNPASATSFRIHSAIKKTFYWKKAKRILYFLFRCSTAVVQLTVNQLVVGSIPATGAKPSVYTFSVNRKWVIAKPQEQGSVESDGSPVYPKSRLHGSLERYTVFARLDYIST